MLPSAALRGGGAVPLPGAPRRPAVVYSRSYFISAWLASQSSAFSFSACALSFALVFTYSLIFGSVPLGRTQTQLPLSSSKYSTSDAGSPVGSLAPPETRIPFR